MHGFIWKMMWLKWKKLKWNVLRYISRHPVWESLNYNGIAEALNRLNTSKKTFFTLRLLSFEHRWYSRELNSYLYNILSLMRIPRVRVNCSKFDCSTINWSTLLAGNQLLDTKFINCSNPVNPGSTGFEQLTKKWQLVDTSFLVQHINWKSQFFTYRNGQ